VCLTPGLNDFDRDKRLALHGLHTNCALLHHPAATLPRVISLAGINYRLYRLCLPGRH
jgi:hypothetical protein